MIHSIFGRSGSASSRASSSLRRGLGMCRPSSARRGQSSSSFAPWWGSSSSSYAPPPSSPPPSPIASSLVPVVLESSPGGERSFDIFSRLLRERIICVHGEVTDHMASLVTAQLLFLEAEAPDRPIYMYINSPGGLVTAGMAMYDTMQYVRPEVHTICMGQAASMGSLLLAGGAKGCRFALPNSRIMLHQPRGGAQGMAADIDIQAREILRTRANLNNLYVHHTGQTLDEIERVMDRDFFMDVNQSIEFGVIDDVLDRRDKGEEAEEDGDGDGDGDGGEEGGKEEKKKG